MKAAILLISACLALASSVAATAEPIPSAKFLPMPEELALPSEQPLLNETLQKLVTAEDPDKAIEILDAALIKLPEPTKLRGFVQLSRAGMLLGKDDYPRAIEAVEESVRLLPGYSAPLITAASLYAYSNQPAKAADYLLRAADADPDAVRRIDDYEVNNIIRRLSYARDDERIKAISDRLLAIGWLGSGLASRSNLAMEAIERRVRESDIAGARALVPKLLLPSQSYNLLAMNEFSAIWPDIERWAGPKLANQWRMYLKETHDRWAASKSTDTVQDYSSALLAAGHYDTVIRNFFPLLTGELDARRDHDLIFVVTGVARALASKGRWNDVEALFQHTQKVWPLDSHPNAINIGANRARYLLFAGRYADALPQIDAAIAEGRRRQVNPDALGAMHHYRACILHQLGRDAEAGVSVAIAAAVEFPFDVARLHLCMGNEASARRVLLEALKDRDNRKRVIGLLQENDLESFPSDYSRRMTARVSALKSDPVLLDELRKFGRVLPFGIREGAPPEQEQLEAEL